jgi:hypothetical protein
MFERVAGYTMKAFPSLLDYEMEALLEALRRDLRHSSQRANAASEMADVEYHLANYRYVARLLEALNPKKPSVGCNAQKCLAADFVQA